MKNFVAVYFPEQWSITNGSVPVCHLEGEYNNQSFAEFVANALNTGQQSVHLTGLCVCPEEWSVDIHGNCSNCGLAKSPRK